MSSPAGDEYTPEGRDYHQLLHVLDHALDALFDPATPPTLDALTATFEGAVAAFGAERAALLATRPTLRVLVARGLSDDDVRAAEAGESSPGVSSTVIRQVLDSGKPVLVRDPRHEPAPIAESRALAGKPYSVLCAPVLDPSGPGQAEVLGVLYFQNNTFKTAFAGPDLTWITTYARALSGTLHALTQTARLRELALHAGSPQLVGDSLLMLRLRQEIEEVWIPAAQRKMPDPLLLLGPSGSGKELVARYIHAYSCRAGRPFAVLNCAEIDRGLAASRLFGYKRGAFTGADRDTPGLVRSAEGGVLLLDELGALLPEVQSQLLRVLDTHVVQGIGEVRETQVDVWILLATSSDLAGAAAAGTFSRDLWERIKIQQIHVPSLRERPEDIRALAEHFLGHYERLSRKHTFGFDAGAMNALLNYSWPGNVRELSRLVSTLVLRVRPGKRISRELLEHAAPHVLHDTAGQPDPGRPRPVLKTLVDDYRSRLILQTIRDVGGDIHEAARVLGTPWGTFSGYLQRYKLTKPRRKPEDPADDAGNADE